MANAYNIEAPLLTFSSAKGNTSYTIKSSFSGIAIFGTTGSGKSSSSAALIARKMLSAGYAGVVLTCKEDEKDRWLRFAKETARSKDVLVIEPGCPHTFNWLDWVASMDKGAYTSNIVKILTTIVELVRQRKEGTGGDSFWIEAVQQLLTNVIDLCLLAYGKLTVRDMHELIVCAPQKDKRKAPGEAPNSFDRAFTLAQKNVDAQIAAWKETLSPEQRELIRKDRDYHDRMATDQLADAARLQLVDQFFSETYRNLADRTKSIVFFSCTSFLSSLLSEPIYSLFCKHASTYSPEDTLRGKIIILNIPVKEHYEAGIYAQCLFKLLFQRMAERRNIDQDGGPLFMFMDEAQFFFLPNSDPLFQATARSSRVCSVYITQSLSSYYSAVGGDSFAGQHKVKVLLGTLALKIFHANEDETNRYASGLIGEFYTEDISRDNHYSDSFSMGRSSSWILEPAVRPEQLNYLRCGGPQNNFLCDAYVHRLDGVFDNGLNFKRITFRQF